MFLSVLLPAAACSSAAKAQDGPPAAPFQHALQLQETGSYLELPPDAFNDFTEATVEAWVKWNAFGNRYQRVFNYGSGGRDFGITTLTGTNTLWFVIAAPGEGLKVANVENTLKAGEWTHVAAVAGSGGMKLYLNGALVAANPYTGCFKGLGPENPSRLGQTVTEGVDDTPFDGELAEVRVWQTARSQEQIRDNLLKPLTGNEEGLAGLWNFADPANPGRDASPNHHDGKLVGSARAGKATASLAPTVSARPGGKDALMLNGVNAGVESESGWLAEVSDNFTMEFWALPTAARSKSEGIAAGANGQRYVFYPSQGSLELGGDPHAGVGVSLGTNGVAVVEHADNYMPLVVEVPTPIIDWVHVAVVYRDKTPSLYLNGTLAGTGPRSGRTVHPSLWDWQTFNPDYGRFAGAVDEVRIRNVALTEEQIRKNVTAPLTGNEPGLVGWWNFDDPANPGRDASARRRDVKVTAPLVSTLGGGQAPNLFQFTGNVLRMDGDGGVETGVVIIPTADDYTVECWAFTGSIDTQQFRIIAAQDRQFYLGTTTSGRVRTGDYWTEHNVPFPYGGWHHFAFCKRGDGGSLYIDGNLARERTGTLPSPAETGTFRIGRQWSSNPEGGGEQWMGFIDEVRVWRTARTVAQIRENLTKTLRGDEPDLIGLWNFDDGTAKDLAPGAHHGSLQGSAAIVPAASAGVSPLTAGSGVVASLSGRITDAAGRPVRGAEVRVMQGESAVGTVKSGESGDYFLLFVRNTAPYRVLASQENLEAESAETKFAAGGNKLDLTLHDMLRLAGTLSGPDGQPRRGVKVEAVNSEGAVAAFSVSDAKGKFILRRVPDGKYKLRAAGVDLNEGKALAVSAEAPLSDLKLTLPAATAPERPPVENHALVLDGKGQYVNLPMGMFGNLRETTIEGWVRFDSTEGIQRFFSFGTAEGQLYLGMELGHPLNVVLGCFPPRGGQHVAALNVMEKSRWCHVAAVIDARETRLYFNGALAGTAPKASSFADFPATSLGYIGWWRDPNNGFAGGIDEVRVWAAARTVEEIRATMFQRLSGREEGLAGLWNFDDPAKPGRDATPNGFDGAMMQHAAAQPVTLPSAVTEITQWASLAGATVDVDGRTLPKAKVVLDRGEEHLEAEVDQGGNFSFLIRASDEEARLIATDGDLSSVPASLVLSEGPHRLDLTLRDAAPLSGHVRTPDGNPIPTVVIQAVPVVEDASGPAGNQPGLIAELYAMSGLSSIPTLPDSALPDSLRVDRAIDFPVGVGTRVVPANGYFVRWTGQLRVAEAGDYTFHLESDDGSRLLLNRREVVNNDGFRAMVEKSGTRALTAGDHELRLEYFDGGGVAGCRLAWSSPTMPRAIVPAEALFHRPHSPRVVTTIADARGRFRFPKVRAGRYTLRAHVHGGFAEWEQGRELSVEPDKQLANLDFTLAPIKQGRWKTYAHQDGLPADDVTAVFQAADGALWFGAGNGAARFDGRQFSKITTEDGLPAGSSISAIREDEGGRIWFATNKGLCLFDPKTASPGIVVFTTADGLPADQVTALAKDQAGRLWVGTSKGLCQFDPAARKAGDKAFIGTRKEPAETVKDLASGAHHGTLRGAARLVETQRPAGGPKEQPMPTGKVLELGGDGDYVELPAAAFADLDTVTVEARVKWESLQDRSRVFDFVLKNRLLNLHSRSPDPDLWSEQFNAENVLRLQSPRVLQVGEWVHLAVTVEEEVMRLYLNGVLLNERVVSEPDTFRSSEFSRLNLLGRSNAKVVYPGDHDFDGQMDEVRVWKVARSAEEIRENMASQLTGNEPGLAGLWNFDETAAGEREVPLLQDPIFSLHADSKDGLWVGTAKGVTRISTSREAGHEIQAFTPNDGLATGTVHAIFEAADGRMWFGTSGGGVSRMTRDASATPTPGAQAATEFSFTTFGPTDGLPTISILDIAQDADGAMWFAGSRNGNGPGTSPALIRYDGRSFVAFSPADGLPSAWASCLQIDTQGGLWIGTFSGLSHFDPASFTLLGEADGLDPGMIRSIASTADGNVWFLIGNNSSKLSRFDGMKLVKVARDDGLPGTLPSDLYVDRDGAVLVADVNQPIARFDSASATTELRRFASVENSSPAFALARSTTGALWCGTDQGAFVQGQSAAAGRAIGAVGRMAAGRDGVMWFGSYSGTTYSIWRRVPEASAGGAATWEEFKCAEGLAAAGQGPNALLPLPDGSLLVGTSTGTFQLEGGRFAPWPKEVPRLQNLPCLNLTLVADGSIWMATTEGVFHTDGITWTSFDTRDGLPENIVTEVYPAADGTVWFGGLTKGLARYRPSTSKPRPPVVTAQTDHETTEVGALPTPSTGQRVTFKFDVVDFYTAIGKRQYRWQFVKGTPTESDLKDGWKEPQTVTQIDQVFPEPGDWTLAVQYIDRDLNYSQPTLVTVAIALPWHDNMAIIVPAAVVSAGLLVWAFIAKILYARKRKEAQVLREKMLAQETAARHALESKNSELEEARSAADEANKAKSTFLANYTGSDHSWYVGHFWSLAVEEHFYFLWPAAFLLLRYSRRRMAWVIGLALLIALWRAVDFKFQITGVSAAVFWGRTDIQADGILWGVLIALLYANPMWKTRLRQLFASPLSWTLLCLLLMVLEFWPDVNWKLSFMLITVKALLMPLLILGTQMHSERWPGRILETPVFRWVGRLSYSLYLWQQLFLVWSEDRVDALAGLQSFPVNLLAVFACATFSMLLIETPLIGFGHRLAKKIGRR